MSNTNTKVECQAKLESFAIQALIGIISSSSVSNQPPDTDYAARLAVQYAKALIKEVEKG